MSNEVGNKRRKKTKEEAPPSWTSLPDSVAVTCVAGLSRSDRAALSLVSKSHRALVASPELWRTRSLIGCTEASFYVCLRTFPDPTPRWFILRSKRKDCRLIPIRSHPNQAQESSSFVVVDWGIYVIGGLRNGNPTWDVLFLDCRSKTWSCVPSMKFPRASASASLVDGKIYVLGGCEDSSNWGEVFDTETQTWDTFAMAPEMNIHQSVVIEDEKKRVYMVDEENQTFWYMPSEGTWTRGKRDEPRPGNINTNDWCVIGKLLYCRGPCGRIMWCEPKELDWKEVKGLEGLQKALNSSRQVPNWEYNNLYWIKYHFLKLRGTRPFKVRYGITRLSTNSAGNIVLFWKTQLEDPRSFELWAAEISLEIRNGEVWGGYKWVDSLFKLDPQSLSSSDKVYVDDESSEEEDSEEEEMKSFVAFIGITDYVDEEDKSEVETVTSEAVLSDSESELDGELDVKQEYQAMCETLLRVGKEKLTLEQKNADLQAEVTKLRGELVREVAAATESRKE